MAKDVVRIAKLQFIAGQAKPGPELAGLGIVMPEFTKQFNDATRDRGSEPVPVAITIYSDKSFDFKLFTAPASYKILEALKLKKGSDNAKTTKVGTLSDKDITSIAEYKLVDLNTNNIEQAKKIIAGTAKNMGVLVEGFDNVEEALAEAKKAKAAAEFAEAADAKLAEEMEAAKEAKNAEIEVETIAQKAPENEGDK